MALAPFVRTGDGVHPTIDFARLVATFPDQERDLWNISSPARLIWWEKLRREYELDKFAPVPCDVFVWATGTAPDPRMTRVGGVPFLPKRTAWPQIDGKDATFLCQFDFRDSRDLVGELPGDLLLVFVDDIEEAPLSGDVNGMHFEWVQAEEQDLWSEVDMPKTPGIPFITAWGVRHRSNDYPEAWDAACEIDPKDYKFSALPVLWATKIGGVPHDSQDNLDEVPTDYLCQLVSIQAASTAWPWCDRSEPYDDSFGDDGIHSEQNKLMIGDMGELTFFLRPDGTIETESACG